MNRLIELFQSQLENQLFTGVFLLGILGWLGVVLRNVPSHLWVWVKRRFITTIDISDHDPAFYWIQSWLGKHEYTSRARLLTLTTRNRPRTQHDYSSPEKSDNHRSRVLTEIIYSPAPGRHVIRYNGHILLLQRERKEAEGNDYVPYHETFVFQTLSKNVVQDLVYEAREAAFPPEDNRVGIYKAGWSSWRLAQLRPPRPSSSVVLQEGVFEEIEEDVVKFLNSKEWYGQHGIPYQRGYLFDGEPGNGKTSVVTALASKLGRDIYILNVAGLSDERVSELLPSLPENSFLLLEDIDRAFAGRERTSDSSEKLTFSGLINAIDGVAAPSGRILIMTTNHPENLDPALMRPGRVDKRVTFCNATADMARRLFLQFFPTKPGLGDEMFDLIQKSTRKYSMAELQELMIRNMDNPVGVLVSLQEHAPGQTADHIRVA